MTLTKDERAANVAYMKRLAAAYRSSNPGPTYETPFIKLWWNTPERAAIEFSLKCAADRLRASR